jgi:hypothetical protein
MDIAVLMGKRRRSKCNRVLLFPLPGKGFMGLDEEYSETGIAELETDL